MMRIVGIASVFIIYSAGIEAQSEGPYINDTDWNSCVGRCDEAYFPGRPCYCNDVCSAFENCCYDFIRECAPEQATDDSWRDYEGHSYRYFINGAVNALQAQQECRINGGMLASINDERENSFIVQEVLRKRTLSAFIGGTDIDQEGVWVWRDGRKMPLPTSSWHEWYDGEPNNADSAEHCSVISNYAFWETHKFILEQYYWRDYSCNFNPSNEIQGFICERSLKCENSNCENGGSCVYTSGIDVIECVCPAPFVGDRCQYEEIPGQYWTNCGNTYHNMSEGIITSPLYPKQYPANVRCGWTIDIEEGRSLFLSITSLDIEGTKRCVFDYLAAYEYDDNFENATTLFGPTCGSPLGGYEGIRAEDMTSIRSSAKRVYIEFYTDTDVAGTGFALEFSQGQCGMGSGQSGCGTPRVFTASCGDVTLTHETVASPKFCDFLIDVPAGNFIKLTFNEFKSYDTGNNCENGGVSVYDGDSEQSSFLQSLCGWRAPVTLISTSNKLYITLSNLTLRENEIIHFAYEVSTDRIQTEPIMLFETKGIISLDENSLAISESSESKRYQWLISTVPGNQINISWESLNITNMEIYVGQAKSEVSKFYHFNLTSQSSVLVPFYKALIDVECRYTDDCQNEFELNYESVDWTPKLSGCYRPFHYHDFNSRSTENSIVTPLNPIMLVASQSSYDSQMPGYSAGLYCKWKIKANSNETLKIDFLDARIYPMSPDCAYDGLHILRNNESYAESVCGAESLESRSIVLEDNEITLVFYSDPGFGFRHQGVLRALIQAQETGRNEDNACTLWQMGNPTTQRAQAECGIILSPRFPGFVPPGLWFWVFTPPRNLDISYSVYVSYIRGPGVKDDDCEQSFKIIEVAADAEELRLFEADILTLCGTTELFIPPNKFTLPPKQRLGLELKTILSSIDQKWEFKIAFKVQEKEKPKEYPVTGDCPDEYVEWRGSCYRYYQWVLRHYQPEEYSFQATWQSSLQHCENNNATLLSIYDEDESYFINYALQTFWFWNGAATIKESHKLILLGLDNKQQKYRWTSGVNLGYADWYQPKADWTQDVALKDDLIQEIVNFDLPQPTADSASLCTGFLPISSASSLNWVKIPCDYPLFAAGVICKRPLPNKPDTHQQHNIKYEASMRPYVPHMHEYIGCQKGWIFIQDSCYKIFTNYTIDNNSGDSMASELSFSDAHNICSSLNGSIHTSMDDVSYDKLMTYLHIWNHTQNNGNILITANAGYCTYIKITKQVGLDDSIGYAMATDHCSNHMHHVITSVVCLQNTLVHTEKCGKNEFMCENSMCISSAYVCDGKNDCKDSSDEYYCDCGLSEFSCSNGECISISLRCDFQLNCVDGSDEYGCVLAECSSEEFRCNNGECINATKVCDLHFTCVDGSDEDNTLCAGQCSGFQCYSGVCLDDSLRQDRVTDCPGLTMEDETGDTTELLNLFDVYYDDVIVNETSHYGCREGMDYTSCHQGELQCFDRAQTCIYDTVNVDNVRDYSVLTSCRDGAHLRILCENVQCPGMYHCANSYCIPMRKVCDTQIDCPEADDEENCQEYICPGMFHCKDTNICIPHDEVCDGVVNCLQHGDDEIFCMDTDVLCDECSCDGHIAYCSDANITTLPVDSKAFTRSLRAIFLSNNDIKSLPNNVFHGLHWLTRLILSHNQVTRITEKTFSHLANLHTLDLSHNRISELSVRSFQGLINLEYLDLSHNRLTVLTAADLNWLESLNTLILEDNQLDNIAKGTFDEVTALYTLRTDAFKICCVAQNVPDCTPEADEFSSCEDLMANYALQVSIWILGMVALIGNGFVVVWRVLTDRKKASSFFIINLGCSDFFMGVYMLIIASVDVHYRGVYIVYADTWRNSWLCQLAGVLATISSEVSVFMLTTITMERCLTILYPLKFGQMRLKIARGITTTGWLVCFLLSVIPLSKAPLFGDAFYGRTGVCLPFVVSSQRLPGWEYSVFIFLVLNLISFITIFIGYTLIFIQVKSSLKVMAEKSTNTTDEYALAKKLAIIVASDFMCWVPIIMIGFAALGGATIAPEVSAWIAVFILPLNSAVNPVLYTMSAIKFGRRKKKKYMYDTSKSTNVTSMSTAINPKVCDERCHAKL